MRHWIAVLGLLLIVTPSAWAAPAIVAPGAYNDAMLIGYDPTTGAVSGYFDMVQGGQPSFSCIFYLKGQLAGSRGEVDTYFPETPASDLIKGQLVLTSPGHFQVSLRTEHGGCGNLEHFADQGEPATFDLAAAHPWTAVAVIKADRAYFYDAPTSATPRKAYVVKGDGVGVRTERAGWLEVDYVGGDKMVSGWVKQADVY